MRMKKGVRIQGMRPEIVWAGMICDGVFKEAGKECVQTSGIEGRHSHTSEHYQGNAIDLRTRHLTEDEAETITARIRKYLSQDFVVLLESNHIHVHYEPRQIT